MQRPIQEGYLHIEDEQIPLIGIDDQTIVFSKKDNEVPVFNGMFQKIMAYRNEAEGYWSQIYKSYDSVYPELRNAIHTDSYFKIYDNMLTDRIKFLQDYFRYDTASYIKLFVEREQQNLITNDFYYSCNFSGPDLRRFGFFNKTYGGERSYTRKYSDEMPLDDTILTLTNLRFVRIFFSQCVLQSFINNNTTYETFYRETFKYIDDFVTNRKLNHAIKLFIISQEIPEVLRSSDGDQRAEAIQVILNEMATSVSDKTIVSNLERKLIENGRKMNEWKNVEVPSVELIDLSGKTRDLSEFKGKLIYIDVWASWCGPCIGSLPAWNKLVKEFQQNDQIVFITVSIDDSQKKWNEALKKYKPEGMQLLSPGGSESSFSKAFQLESIPRYILVGRDGKMLNALAPHPDSAEIKKLLLK